MADAPSEALQVFVDVVVDDADLQERLLAAPTQDAFVELVVRVADERGVIVTSEDVVAALVARRRAQFERWV